jgi:predicted peroxiredoxin
VLVVLVEVKLHRERAAFEARHRAAHSASMVAVAKLLIVAVSGSQDPTRASIPFHVAVNGAAAAGMEVGVALAGDSTELLKQEVAGGVRGVGVPPLSDLLAGCRDKGVKVYV